MQLRLQPVGYHVVIRGKLSEHEGDAESTPGRARTGRARSGSRFCFCQFPAHRSFDFCGCTLAAACVPVSVAGVKFQEDPWLGLYTLHIMLGGTSHVNLSCNLATTDQLASGLLGPPANAACSHRLQVHPTD